MIPNVAHFIWFGRTLPWLHEMSIVTAAQKGAFSRLVLHHGPELEDDVRSSLEAIDGLELPADAPWYHRLAAGVGGMVGDAPAMLTGGLVTQLVTGGKAGPIGMAAATFAAPMALREALVEAYTHNYATTWEGTREVGFAAMRGAVKGRDVVFVRGVHVDARVDEQFDGLQ